MGDLRIVNGDSPMGEVPGPIEGDPFACLQAMADALPGVEFRFRTAVDEALEPVVIVHIGKRTFALTTPEARYMAASFDEELTEGGQDAVDAGLPEIIIALRQAANEAEAAALREMEEKDGAS